MRLKLLSKTQILGNTLSPLSGLVSNYVTNALTNQRPGLKANQYCHCLTNERPSYIGSICPYQ